MGPQPPTSGHHHATLFVDRLSNSPIIRPEMLAAGDGENINGPSLIRAPAWLPGRLGKYYLYFAHHRGQYIRLAYADRLEGPWTIHQPGTLRLGDVPACRNHIASPDAHIDEERRQLRMYFHGPSRITKGQKSYVALSSDGLAFAPSDTILGPFYFRVARWRGQWIAMAKGGLVYVSKDGLSDFRPAAQSPFPLHDPKGNAPGDVRHVALQSDDHGLRVYYTRVGDCPESILRARVVPDGPDMQTWRASEFEAVLAPEQEWEGTDVPLRASLSGASSGRENALRDPAIYVEDGRTYLLYSVAGESGIAIAELHDRT
jgi:hypothetical protein